MRQEFDCNYALDELRESKYMNKKRRRKMIRSFLFDDSFIEWLFQPKKIPNLNEIVSSFYDEFTKKRSIEAIIDVVEDEGYHSFTRSHATFLTSVANIAISANDEALKSADKDKKAGNISRRDVMLLHDEINEKNEMIADLLKVSKKIIKRDATSLARECHLPRYITTAAFTTIPEPKYIGKFQIGYYLNNLFNIVYAEVDRNGKFDRDVRWKAFFREIFGKENVVEAATFILLEGVSRIDKYENRSDVRACWDSLTTFALKALEESPMTLRNQMIELYCKRIEKMFANNSFDLRVNLLDIDEHFFPNLVETINKYAEKIAKIIKGE